MKIFALAALALAVILVMPASAQSGVRTKNALVVVSAQEEIILQSKLEAGGSSSSIQKELETAEKLLSPSVPHVDGLGGPVCAGCALGCGHLQHHRVCAWLCGFVRQHCSWRGSRTCVESAKVLGSTAFTKHLFFASPHYCAADLLAAAGVDAVCERRGHKAGYEKD